MNNSLIDSFFNLCLWVVVILKLYWIQFGTDNQFRDGQPYTKKIKIPGELGKVRIDKENGLIIVTVQPGDNKEFLIYQNIEMKGLFNDPIPNPESRVCVGSYSISCQDGISSCLHSSNPTWKKFATGIKMEKGSFFWIDRFGCVIYDKKKAQLYKFPKIMGWIWI